MLDFMYKGEASVRQEDLAAFLKLAETLKVKGLAGDKVCILLISTIIFDLFPFLICFFIYLFILGRK
mgnify:FL=1